MWMLLLNFIQRWRTYLLLGAVVIYTLAIWRVCAWHESYKHNKELVTQVKHLEQGARNVMEFNQKWDAAPKDSCTSAAIPPATRQLLK